MTLRIPLSSIAPDLRFALAGALAYPQAFPRLGGVNIAVTSDVPPPPAVPAYLRYADKDAELVVPLVDEDFDVERELAEQIHALGLSGDLDDLALVVVVLDVVDSCFQESGLWGGNIYLVDRQGLAAALEIAGAGTDLCEAPVGTMRELAALELAYLFPVESKFRSGRYDEQVQYRLNGWGRALAGRLAVGRTAERASEFRQLLSRHLATEHQQYASYLRQLDGSRQDYSGDLLDEAMQLPIPVLV